MSFESTIADTPNPPQSPIPAEHPVLVLLKIRKALLASRRSPETIYVKDKRLVTPISALLVELYGTRGERTPVLHSPDEPVPFTIRWGL